MELFLAHFSVPLDGNHWGPNRFLFLGFSRIPISQDPGSVSAGGALHISGGCFGLRLHHAFVRIFINPQGAESI